MSDDEKQMYLLHSQLPSFKRKVEESIITIEEFAKKAENPYSSWSSGKDSTVTLDLARKVIPDIPAVYFNYGVETPGTREVIERTNGVVEITPKETMVQLAKKHGLYSKEVAGIMGELVDKYERISKSDGLLMGIRKEESMSRRYNSKRGSVYKKQNGMWVCTPIVNWTISDVFAYLFSRELPIHPHYLLPGPFETKERRVDSLISGLGEAEQYGRHKKFQYFYPDLYRDITAKLPELKLR